MSIEVDQSENEAFTTELLRAFIQREFKRTFITNSVKFTGDETYLKVVIPALCPFHVILHATHLGVRGCCTFKKYTDADRWYPVVEPACMVLMDEEENILLTIKLKHRVMLRQSLNSILNTSGPAIPSEPEIVQKQGMDATEFLEVIKEIRGIVNEIIEKHPDAFRT